MAALVRAAPHLRELGWDVSVQARAPAQAQVFVFIIVQRPREENVWAGELESRCLPQLKHGSLLCFDSDIVSQMSGKHRLIPALKHWAHR